MLVGISVFLASITFYIYRFQPDLWAARLRFLSDSGERPSQQLLPGQDDLPKEQSTQDGTTTPDVEQEKTPRRSASPSKARTASPPQDVIAKAPDSPSTPTTPKASDFQNVPSFSLVSHDGADDEEDDEEDNLPPPSFPALNSAQRASGPAPVSRGPPTLKPLSNQTASQLMPPPPRIAPGMESRQQTASSLMPPPRLPQSSLRAPSGPLPNRGPPVRASGNSLGLPPTAPIKTPNPRQKVQLTPGHSPLDWAALVKSNNNLSGVPNLQRVTPSLLKVHNGRRNKMTGETMPAWSAYQGKVYNITPYLPFHPGGEGELRRAAGKDGEKLFAEVHPWVNWDNMLSECVVGILVPEHSVREDTAGSLEDMD